MRSTMLIAAVCSMFAWAGVSAQERSTRRRGAPHADAVDSADGASLRFRRGSSDGLRETPGARKSTAQVAQRIREPEAGGLAPQKDGVQLPFPAEVELKTVVDFVSQRLDINIIYDEQLLTKKVNIRSPGAVPTASLLALLQSALKMKDLALEDAEVPGWKRIVQTNQLPSLAPFAEDGKRIDQLERGTAVTQSFVLRYVDAVAVDQAIKPFLSGPGANSLALKDQAVLIVTDFASNLTKIGRLVALIDRQKADSVVQLLRLKHAEATQVVSHISTLLAAKAATPAGTAATSGAGTKGGLEVTVDERTNQLIVVGAPEEIAEVVKLVESLDVPLETSTKVYKFEFASAERIDELVQNLIDPETTLQRFSSAIDRDGNQLLVTATDETLKRIDQIVKALDKAPSQDQNPVRFYKLENVTAWEILATLRSLEGEGNGRPNAGSGDYGRIRGVSGGTRSPFYPSSNQPVRPGSGGPFVPGPNLPTFPGQSLPAPPAVRDSGGSLFRGQEPTVPDDTSQLRLPAGDARITADESSNSLIIVAEPEVQRVYAELIRTLDRRRYQVLIEAHLIVIDTSDDFALGVEFSAGDRTGDKKLFAFTSFGLSNVDPTNGALSIIPGTGFNGTLIDADVADVVVRALTKHTRSRVLSAPKILVNDNALGVLTSVEEEPFTSVNASNVVATTSFAGFAEAGTTIEVTPHISSEDYLQLEYRVLLNSFTGSPVVSEGGGVSPPPRKTDEVSSVITIPDGHTVIVGGLNRRQETKDFESFPFIEKIPLVRYLAGKETKSADTSSLFVFIRPIILRDDKFRALKYLSRRDVKTAGIKGDYPPSQPLLMK